MRPGALLAVALLAASPAWAGDHGHQEARALVAEGKILPLATLLQRIEAGPDDRVIEAKLKRRGERYLYEIELLRPSGVVDEFHVDATDGSVLGRKREH